MSKPEIDLTFSMGNNEPSEREKQMSALVDEKLAAMNEKQWRVRVCGRSVKVREQVDWIVKVVLVAKDVISSVVSMNPVHAGLPWAEVCMLLPVSDLELLLSILHRLTIMAAAGGERY